MNGATCWVWTCSLYLFVSIFYVLKIIFYFLLSLSVWILMEFGNTISGISGENWENNFTGIVYTKSLLYIYSTIWNICQKFTFSIMKWESICTYMCVRMYNSTRYCVCKRNCTIREERGLPVDRWDSPLSLPWSQNFFNEHVVIIVTCNHDVRFCFTIVMGQSFVNYFNCTKSFNWTNWISSQFWNELVHCSFNELPWNELNDYDELMSWWLNEDLNSHSDNDVKKTFF